MRLLIILYCLLSVCEAQTRGLGQSTAEEFDDLPVAKLVFSAPNLKAPVELPYTLMDGAPVCGQEGRVFFQFLTPPPTYNTKDIIAVTSDGKVTHYPLEQISNLKFVSVLSLDPGLTRAVMLLKGTDAGRPSLSSSGYYIALFSSDGRLQNKVKLDLEAQPSKVAQLTDDTFLVIGVDAIRNGTRFLIVDSGGKVLRDRAADAMFSAEKLAAGLNSQDVRGGSPNDLPGDMRLAGMLNLVRMVHTNQGVVVYVPGSTMEVVEIYPSGESRKLELKLPKEQLLQSILVDQRFWYVATTLRGSDTESALFQVNTQNGRATRRIDTSGVPSTTIACPTETGFFAFKWIEKRPYVINGEMR